MQSLGGIWYTTVANGSEHPERSQQRGYEQEESEECAQGRIMPRECGHGNADLAYSFRRQPRFCTFAAAPSYSIGAQASSGYSTTEANLRRGCGRALAAHNTWLVTPLGGGLILHSSVLLEEAVFFMAAAALSHSFLAVHCLGEGDCE